MQSAVLTAFIALIAIGAAGCTARDDESSVVGETTRDYSRSADTAASRADMIGIGGEQMAASDVVGRPVLTPAGDLIGEISHVIRSSMAVDTVIVDLDEGNKFIDFGSSSAAVDGDGLRFDPQRGALIAEPGSIRPAG
jgi:hypothetical protein